MIPSPRSCAAACSLVAVCATSTTCQWSSSSIRASQLATELDEDGESLFGLAALGFGRPELG
jgi:hypothetical protein